jgi:starch-binding outer membrane protein, SusD/RagB family
MKNISFLIAILLVFSTASCDKFLEEDTSGLITPENYFQNASDASAAVTGIYALLKNNALYGQLGLDAFYGSGADEVGPNRPFGFVDIIQGYTITEETAEVVSQKTGVAQTWKDLYRVVLNANLILNRVEGNTKISAADQETILAEALFLRSLAYFHLTNLWGAVPYYRNVLSTDEINNLGRTDAEKIRAEIIEDLKKAMDKMPATIAAKDNGRASKWAAAMVLAKIYLVQKKWADVKAICLTIINTSDRALLPKYGDVFSPNLEYNKEIIWELDFAKDLNSQYEKGVPTLAGNGNWYASMFCPRLIDEPINSADKNKLIAALAKNGESFNGTGAQCALPDLIKKFPKNDPRRAWTVKEEYEGIPLKFAYLPKMWNITIATSPRFNHSDNKLIFRLADTYLMLAEAENELNGPAAAYQYVNAIRRRAFGDNTGDWANLTQATFRTAMYDERKWELAGESHRRFDLIRWGILVDVVKQTEQVVYADAAKNIKPHHVLLPIPPQELRLNPKLLAFDPTNNGYRK